MSVTLKRLGRPATLAAPVHRAYRLERRHVDFLLREGLRRGQGASQVLRELVDFGRQLDRAALDEALRRGREEGGRPKI